VASGRLTLEHVFKLSDDDGHLAFNLAEALDYCEK
jgi:hypothetical protein